jgi:hypothetical protein
MQAYGTIVPWRELPDSGYYPEDRNVIVSEDPPVLITHNYSHDTVPEIDYETYESEGTTAVIQFFNALVNDLEEMGPSDDSEGVPLRVVLNHAVHHTDLDDDEAYEVLTAICEPHDTPLLLTDGGRVVPATGQF